MNQLSSWYFRKTRVSIVNTNPFFSRGSTNHTLKTLLEIGPQQKKHLFCLVSGKQRDPKKSQTKSKRGANSGEEKRPGFWRLRGWSKTPHLTKPEPKNWRTHADRCEFFQLLKLPEHGHQGRLVKGEGGHPKTNTSGQLLP